MPNRSKSEASQLLHSPLWRPTWGGLRSYASAAGWGADSTSVGAASVPEANFGSRGTKGSFHAEMMPARSSKMDDEGGRPDTAVNSAGVAKQGHA
jgi:hypothetical protein